MQVHNSLHKTLTLLPILWGTCPVNVLPSFFLNTPFNFILATTPTSSKWSLSSRLFCHNPYAFLFSITRATCPASLILIDMIALLGRFKTWNSLLRGFLEPLVTFSLLPGPNNLLSQGEASLEVINICRADWLGESVKYSAVYCWTECSWLNMSTHCPLVKSSLAHLFHTRQHGEVNQLCDSVRNMS